MNLVKNSNSIVEIYDCTLRDGVQMAGLSPSYQDKIDIIHNLSDLLNIPYIELYPYSNPKDRQIIKDISENHPHLFKKLVMFGSTRHVNNKAEDDPNLKAIIETKANYTTIFGKCWQAHLEVLHATREQNIAMISESVKFLKENEMTVFFDAEHFFDGYKDDPEFALEAISAAEKAGADALILCDTNGGSLPNEIYNIVKDVISKSKISLGIHTHNDSELGVANAIVALQACLEENRNCQIQGTINGIGERCGNCNLTSIIPIVSQKYKLPNIISSSNLEHLTEVAESIAEILNINLPHNSPFVGSAAFAHKGGMHIAAIQKNTILYEHSIPESLGNKRNIIISEMSGKSAILKKIQEYNLGIEKNDPIIPNILKKLKDRENLGYSYETADASLELFMRSVINVPEGNGEEYKQAFFDIEYFRVVIDARNILDDERKQIYTDANIKTTLTEQCSVKEFHTAASGNGPVNALDEAIRKTVTHFYPVLNEIELIDYKVRITNVYDSEKSTASRVRVLVETRDKDGKVWSTVGVDVNIMLASFIALIDSYIYKLVKCNTKPVNGKPKVGTECDE